MMGLLRSMSLQSKLLIAMVLLTLFAIGTVAWIGYRNTEEALVASAGRQLLGLQRSKTATLRSTLNMTRNQVLRLSGSPTVADYSEQLLAAYRELGQESPSESMRAAVSDFYAQEFEPALKQNLGVTPAHGAYLPSSNAGWHVQYHYIAQGPRPYDGTGELAGADDRSAYGEALRRIAPAFSDTARRLGYDNILLIDPQTLEVYFSLRASTVLGTSLEDGPYAASNLASIARDLRNSKEEDDYRLGDFEFYRPRLGEPHAFLASPVFDGPRFVAILALRLPIAPIQDILTGGQNWRDEGLGDSGETYLLGPDSTMRNDSRFLIQDRKAFLEQLRHTTLTQHTVSEVERLGTTVLTVPVKHAAAAAALRGESGVMRVTDYRGVPVFMAYGPLDVGSLRWGVISKIDEQEALQPLRDYLQRLLLATALLATLASLVALWLARSLSKPVADLVGAARRVSAGELDAQVPLADGGEFRTLGEAFNDMVRNLRESRAQLSRQVQETERLLVSLLPASGAAHVREGRQDERRSFADVTVAYVSLHGLEEQSDGSQAMERMSELVAAFDEAAEHYDVEKVRTIGNSYLAATGLSVQRPDHTARMVEFAREVVRIVRRFNAEHGLQLTAEIGINAGPVTGGLVGRRRFIYDLWGDTVKLARGIGSDGKTSIQVTREVFERVRDHVAFDPVRHAEVSGIGPVELYDVAEADRP